MIDSKRLIELVVISDRHLGTVGCPAKELNKKTTQTNVKFLLKNCHM